MALLFTSDLHLEGSRPETTERFVEFVRERARHADALYILGDLFEAWIGDDDTDPRLKPVIEALKSLHRAGVPCAIMHGNRDFLIGRRFAAATGCRLLGDYETIDAFGQRVLLTHGDLLCTDDSRYQSLRAMLRDPDWQRDFLGKPLGERRTVAEELRGVSRSETASKPEDIMDVNPAAVEAAMRRFDVRHLLHGHTHRPAVHDLTVEGGAAKRIVLGAWHQQGWFVRWDEHGFTLETC
ncbi:MAG: UDP-2,3-diacylglucosamine diphosphatase [Gammaproteobacteria bacterium]|nr:UDP-2,3-diacylglucosamine diphosphatase [Gammaproteobacteria bacterium]